MSAEVRSLKSIYAALSLAFIMAASALGAYFIFASIPPIWFSLGLYFALVVLAWFDFDHYRIPNWISYPLIVAGLLYAYTNMPNPFFQHVLGALIGYGFIWGLNAYWQTRHGKDGIGMGDAKLLAGAGAWLGVLALPLVSLVASGSALIMIAYVSVFESKEETTPDKRIAFGPFIALGFWVIWIIV